ncbi:GDP-mannose 4,6-dehydratase [Flavobacterium branchiicola]|uniref:GDP-mannose 4,6-dehydratase n=1 Tax=Flavobacterium branchiicola TaxID=1114875 RepID=A0ABV9PHS1_9FLAO
MINKINIDEIYNLDGRSFVTLSFKQPAEVKKIIIMATLNLLEVIRFSGLAIKYYNVGSS